MMIPPQPLYCCGIEYEGPYAIFSSKDLAMKFVEENGNFIDYVEIWLLDDPRGATVAKKIWSRKDDK